MTRPYAEVIGDPIAHSKSPLIHNFWLRKLGIDAEYRKMHVRADELAAYIAGRKADSCWRGCNITVPHKETAAALADTLTVDAAKIGAINALTSVRGLTTGHNTDVAGLAAAVGDIGLRGCKVSVLGAGGAARAAFRFLEDRQASAVTTIARDPEKALRVLRKFDVLAAGVSISAPASSISCAKLVINATQLGMTGQAAMPDIILGEIAELEQGSAVFDMVYAPLETPLLATARARGLRTIDGLQMLVGQAAAAFELFFGQPAPREHDAELRTLLIA